MKLVCTIKRNSVEMSLQGRKNLTVNIRSKELSIVMNRDINNIVILSFIYASRGEI